MKLSVAFLSILSLASLAVAGPAIAKRQCAATLSKADAVVNRLQSRYWNSVLGQYNGGELWTDANAYENLFNLMLAEGSTTWANQILNSNTIRLGGQSGVNWASFINGSYDDAQWVILAFYKTADYLNAHGQDSSKYMSNADAIYQIVNNQWDNTCGGGVWWSSAKNYKNAITNQLFLLTSASGYLRNRNPQYLTNSNNVWNWLKNSGMRNSAGLWNDGLNTATCANNGQTTWTYNQGVIASGLAALYAATRDSSLLTEAEITLDAAINHLTVNNILKESCDDATSSGCNNDQQSFKGIWAKHLQFYLDNANDPARTAKYSPFLGSLSSAVEHFGENSSQDIGSVWYAPSNGGSIFTPEASSSGLAAYVAAAKYGPC